MIALVSGECRIRKAFAGQDGQHGGPHKLRRNISGTCDNVPPDSSTPTRGSCVKQFTDKAAAHNKIFTVSTGLRRTALLVAEKQAKATQKLILTQATPAAHLERWRQVTMPDKGDQHARN
jgi:hypothetical protein